MKPFKLISLILILSSLNTFGQIKDSIHCKRLVGSLSFDILALSSSYLVLNQLWYKDYPQSKYHWFNDGSEWLQVDKFGHAFSSYHVASIYSSQMHWCGLNDKKSAVYGSGLGLLTISMIELLDARSDAWGASAYDLLANSGGAALFMGQELLWNQQKVKMKFSFHSSPFPKYRPDLLGSNFSQQLMKDYNGQTYWLSANVHSLLHSTHWPKWLNIALGYSATGLLGGESNPINYQTPTYSRERQLLLSFDLDLSELPVKSKWLKKVFKLINIVKFPAPTVELRSGKLYGHYLYL